MRRELFDAFWRAVAYCLHPRVIGLSLLPLLVVAGGTWLLGWFFWEDAVEAVRAGFEGWRFSATFLGWLDTIGLAGFRSVVGPLVVVALAVPLIVVASLLLVGLLMTPAIVRLVASRRFPTLEQRRGAGVLASIGWSVGCTAVALAVLVASVPLWFVPPLVLVIPPLVWGWLTCRVFGFDVLADHADADERRRLLRERRWPLLAMGIVTGYLGAAPSLLWAMGALALVFAPILIVVSIWLYTLVFAFSALWFTHYLLAALAALRGDLDHGLALPATLVPETPAAPVATSGAVDADWRPLP